MKSLFASIIFLFFAIQNGFSQNFVNKIMQRSSPGMNSLRLDYLENTENIDDESVTTLYFKYLPYGDDPFSLSGGYYYKLKILDNETGETYEMIENNELPASEKKGMILFHNNGGEIGFSLDFQQIPSTTDISILWGEKEFISDITLDPERNDDDMAFRFDYIFKSLIFYTTMPYKVVVMAEGYAQFTNIKSYYDEGSKPSGYGSPGTVSLLFSGRFDKKIEIKANAEYAANAYWNFSLAPQIGDSRFICLSRETSKKKKR